MSKLTGFEKEVMDAMKEYHKRLLELEDWKTQIEAYAKQVQFTMPQGPFNGAN